MHDVRLRFDKTGMLKYISHLDLNRAMIRALRRSSIPVWYTEGFNPHLYVNFVLPLPLGVESENDVLDIRTENDYPDSDVPAALNAVLPEGLTITAALQPFHKQTELSAAGYLITFDDKDFDSKKIEEAILSGQLCYEKLGKVNGRKAVKKVSLAGSVHSFAVDGNELEIVLDAGNEKNINPFSFIGAVNAYTGLSLTSRRIVRNRLLLADLSNFD